MSSSSSDQAEYKELAEKIQQFLSHQVESNGSLNEAARESLTVANECIEQAYNFQRKPASKELLDAYKASKSPPTTTNQSASGGATGAATNQMPPLTDPAQLITNLASSLFSQVGSSFVGAAASAASAAAQPQPQPQPQPQQQQQPQQQETTSTSTQAQQQSQQQQPSAPPKIRKNASEAEKLAAESFKNQGNDSMRQDKYKEAYDYYTQAINIDNNNAVYYCNRAAASSKLENNQKALDDCLEAIEIDSNYCKAYGRMGLAYASMENHQKAKEAYLRAVELDPTNESYQNNLQIAEAKLAEAQGGAAPGAANGAGGPNVVNMLRSMMNNPEVMSMAMRSLQDPRVQSMFGLGGQGQNPSQPR